MSVSQFLQDIASEAAIVPLTTDQYHRIIETGVLAEGAPIELLDGVLVRKDRSRAGENPTTVGHHHSWVLEQLTDLSVELRRRGAKVRIQQPVTFPPSDEPEPDAAIVAPLDYRNNHPGPADIFCLIEVSDSSLKHDRTTKQHIHARFGVPQYVIVNLVEGVVEVYRRPDTAACAYASREVLARGKTLTIDLKPQPLEIAVDTVLP